MPNDDNDVIRYLSGEMDPTEEVIMEREMMEDDDLLIEVESMRQTMKRLEGLPEKEPPKELTDSIIEQAAEHKKSRYNFLHAIPVQAYKYAAVLLLGIGLSSGFWMMVGSPDETEGSNVQTASAETTLPASFNTVTSEQTKVEPWVDHNNILYFQDRYNSDAAAFKSIIQASKKKVTPLQGPPTPTFRSQNIHLAGAE